MKKNSIIVVFCLINSLFLSAQNTRINNYNNIGWLANTATIKFHKKWSAHLEYQWRREDFGLSWQQSLLRTGINYHINPSAVFRVGYGLIETYPYGEIPINSMGKAFTEHRMYQVLTLSNKIGRFDLSHRYMLEQRWLGSYTKPELNTEDKWIYVNRLRYMVRAQVPLIGKTLENKAPYAAAYDEIFIGFGENVNQNIFDQNRLGLLLGYKFSNQFKLEAGYFNQIVQLGRQVNGRNVMQFNEGFIINAFYNFDLSKK
ncbi:MAG: DUF2490 domain-containing protein [Candidatus Methylacidiphilales bacterium]